MKNTSVELSIVIPIYNESSILLELYRRLRAAAEQITTNYELIFVNDGSKDDSLNGLKELARSSDKTHFISFSRNFGHQIAVSAGLDHAKGNAIVIIDGDLQDPPELIPALYKKYKEGYQVVYAKRKSRQGESFFKKITAKLFYRILSKITSIDIPLDTGDFRLIDKIVVKNLQKMPERQKFLRGQIAWIGFQQTYVEFERDERKHGETGYTIKKMVQFALDGITAFSDVPLRLVTWAGFTVSFFAFLIIIYALISKFVLNEVVTGWTSMIISVMFIGGVQLVAIGIIGEYLSRINNDVKNRPLYIIQETDVE